MANVTEQTSNILGETVEIRIDSTGVATVIPGSSSHGQGHDTMYKMLISDRLGLDEDNIRVTQVDTDVAPNGYGTYASRTATLGGGAAAIASAFLHSEKDLALFSGKGRQGERWAPGQDFRAGRHKSVPC